MNIQGKHFDAFIFDMDGTLLHTLPDLTVTINKALEREGFPTHSEEQVKTYVGNGVLALVKLAVPEGSTDEDVQRIRNAFQDLYADYGTKLTAEFEGMGSVLRELKAQGKKLGIMSNKFEAGVREVEQAYFPGLFDVVHGETDVIPRKPEPGGLLLCAEELGLKPEQCVYFGDSASDLIAAHNAGMAAVAVMWGYQPHEKLLTGEPDAQIESVQDILQFA